MRLPRVVGSVTARQCLSAACRDSHPVWAPAGSSNGSTVFRNIVHSRTNYTFLYFSPERCAGCWDIPALSVSPTVAFADPNEPGQPVRFCLVCAAIFLVLFTKHMSRCMIILFPPPQLLFFLTVGVHLSLTGVAGEAVVSFSTLGGADQVPGVWYHQSSKTTPSSVTATTLAVGTSSTYTATEMCGAPANNISSGDFVSPASLNAVVLSGLSHGVQYEYRVGTVNGSVGRRTWRFTMPVVGRVGIDEGGTRSQRQAPLRVAVFGDMGQVSLRPALPACFPHAIGHTTRVTAAH